MSFAHCSARVLLSGKSLFRSSRLVGIVACYGALRWITSLTRTMDYLAHVTKDVADLIPTFLQNRKNEVSAILLAIEAVDLDLIVHLAERMYALGNPYGFRQITTFGRLIRDAMAEGDLATARDAVHSYHDYLAKVQVVLVDSPVPRPQWKSFVVETKVPSRPPRLLEGHPDAVAKNPRSPKRAGKGAAS
jgi:hypothetical protein